MFLQCYKKNSVWGEIFFFGWEYVNCIFIFEIKVFFWNKLHVPLWNKGTSSIVWCIDPWFPFYAHIPQHIPYIFPYCPAFSFDFSMFPSIFSWFVHIPQHFLLIFPKSTCIFLRFGHVEDGLRLSGHLLLLRLLRADQTFGFRRCLGRLGRAWYGWMDWIHPVTQRL